MCGDNKPCKVRLLFHVCFPILVLSLYNRDSGVRRLLIERGTVDMKILTMLSGGAPGKRKGETEQRKERDER